MYLELKVLITESANIPNKKKKKKVKTTHNYTEDQRRNKRIKSTHLARNKYEVQQMSILHPSLALILPVLSY